VELSIIIPVKDEADSIVPLLGELRVAMAGSRLGSAGRRRRQPRRHGGACEALAAAGYPGLQAVAPRA
jgi:hypothetical protein